MTDPTFLRHFCAAILASSFIVVGGVPALAVPLCQQSQQTLFSCQLRSKDIWALCLTPDPLSVDVVRRSTKGHLQVSPAPHIKQFVDNGNSHGATTVTTLTTEDESITLFLDTNPYDLYTPAIVTKKSNALNTEFCASTAFNLTTSLLNINGKMRLVSLLRLNDFGISNKDEANYDWP